LDEAEAFLTEQADGKPVLLNSWGVLSAVLTNLAGDEKSEAIREVLRDFQGTLDIKTAKAVLEVERAIGGEEVTDKTDEAVAERQVPPQFRKDEEEDRKRKRRPEEEEVEGEVEAEEEEEEAEAETDDEEEEEEEMEEKALHPLDAAFASVRQAFDEAMDTPGDPGMKLGMIQESITGLGAEIQVQVEAKSASAPVDAATISRVVADAVAPLAAQVGALQAQVVAGVDKSSGYPTRRSIKMPPSVKPDVSVMKSEPEASTDDNPTPNLRKLIRRSSVDYDRARGR
jgi:hypothetical protein